MKKDKRPIYTAPSSEVTERICYSMFAESGNVESSDPVDWAEGNTDWWN